MAEKQCNSWVKTRAKIRIRCIYHAVGKRGSKKRKRKKKKEEEGGGGEKWRIVRCAGRGRGCTVNRTRRSCAGTATIRFTAPTFWWRSIQGFFSAVPVSLSLPGRPVVRNSHRLTLSAATVLPIPTSINRKKMIVIIVIMISVILLIATRMMMMEILVPIPTLVMKMTTKKTRERRRRRRRKGRTRWFHGLALLLRCHRRLLRALLRLVLVRPGSGGERVHLSIPMMRSVVLRLKCPLPHNYQTMIHLL